MGEQNSLQSAGVTGEWIWGDDLETVVFAQAYGHGRTIIFRFKFDNKSPRPLASRVATCYHDLNTSTPGHSFPTTSTMREAIWTAVANIWNVCCLHPEIHQLDVIIDILNEEAEHHGQQASWDLCHEKMYTDYVEMLSPASHLSLNNQQMSKIEYRSLVRLNQLGGRGCTTLVYNASDPLTKYVFKGINFRTFLNGYENGHILEEIKSFYRPMELIASMPRHPNIMAPAQTLVTVCKPGDTVPFVCGTLYPVLSNGDLAAYIEKSNETGQRIPATKKAKWCYQMAAAVAHTHFDAKTYHMDLKPGNFLIDNDWNLVLIDWEQSDAPVTTAAPEIDGTWDVEEVQVQNSKTFLQYTNYTGPERKNMPDTTPDDNGWNVWNVGLVWSRQCRKALELAEVFSLSRSMWMLLRQPDMGSFEDITATEEISEDWNMSEDIPLHGRDAVDRCLMKDPNERIGLHELVTFWSKEKREVESV
ncbi:Protein kinase-like (PK-like) [Glarea lozoyensis ATCC 20868]|uniref:Protein kinase-like (PK-like) n=1 Tax=Glarea lozoyensis (strain ATCC 20868 / MF5171) TaxID=1116229 RepID=S3D727_GLAL2|nr:Protein kinase-like (PK-like) [Glarea lozoyensis ATCC 20868]EPE34282.1 Protein kinase-like (PK-like) [Glarea lozoyensis ATCC 20868]